MENNQAQLWNGPAGLAWVEAQDLTDRIFRPLEWLVLHGITEVNRVLDVGCGTGSSTAALARLGAHCTGVDISEPMLTAARLRAERDGLDVRFVCADALSYPFEAASFDRIVSRFGVMFFDDPVAAFANLQRAATPDGLLRFISWRSAEENPFQTTAERAAAPILPDLPARRSDGPGQFAFADSGRVRRILEESGWRNVDIQPVDVECSLPESDLLGYLTRLGPVGRALQELEHPTRNRVIEVVRAAFNPFVSGPDVSFTAACWIVTATATE